MNITGKIIPKTLLHFKENIIFAVQKNISFIDIPNLPEEAIWMMQVLIYSEKNRKYISDKIK